MKAFEKYKNKNKAKYGNTPIAKKVLWPVEREGWRAAMKQVLTLVEPHGDQYGFDGTYFISDVSIDKIRKELEVEK